MIDRNESLRDQIATIVQAGYSERKTSVETADEIRSKISLLSIVTRLERENDELRKDKARMRETLAEIGEYRGEGGPATPWQDIVRDLGQMARAAIAAAMEGDK